jgi:anti-anti-sigma factor
MAVICWFVRSTPFFYLSERANDTGKPIEAILLATPPTGIDMIMNRVPGAVRGGVSSRKRPDDRLAGGNRPERSSKSMKIRCNSESADGVCQLWAEGEIRSIEEPREFREIEDLLGPKCYRRKILFDLEHVPHIDSSGVSWLIHVHKSTRTSGGMLVLYSVPPAIMAVFKLLGMQQYFNLVADERAAKALAQGAKP